MWVLSCATVTKVTDHILMYLLFIIAFYKSIIGEPVGYRTSHSHNKYGMIVNSKSHSKNNKNNEYKDYNINDQITDQ
jgi:hypothetical protein